MPDHSTTEAGQPVMDLASWSLAKSEGKNLDGAVIRHAGAVEIRAIDPSARSVEAIAGTSNVDRYKDRILVEGYDLTDYQRNPVVQWCHEYWSPPIASCVEMSVQGMAFVVRDVFVEREINPFAGMIFDMIAHERRFIRALSVGVQPKTSVYDSERRGYDVLTSQMLEHSWCPIGVNPDALAKAKLCGINVKPMHDWASRCLDGEQGFYVSRGQAERVVKALGYSKGFSALQIEARALAKLRSTNEVTPPTAAEIAAFSGQGWVGEPGYDIFELVLENAAKAQAEQAEEAKIAAAAEEAKAEKPRKLPKGEGDGEMEEEKPEPEEVEEPKEEATAEPEEEDEPEEKCSDDEYELDVEEIAAELAVAAEASELGGDDEIEVDEAELQAAVREAMTAAIAEQVSTAGAAR